MTQFWDNESFDDDDLDSDNEDDHPIFDDIECLEAVQQRVLADAAVLEERAGDCGRTPLMAAISLEEPVIALWLIEHRGQHDVNNADVDGGTTLHWAAGFSGLLEVVQALVAAGANPTAVAEEGYTPLFLASYYGHADIVAFLLQLAAVKATIDHISQHRNTALSLASANGHQPIVQLLLDAGADPTIPAGKHSPLNHALSRDRHAITALLRHHIDEAKRVRECVAAVGKNGGLGEDMCLEVSKYLLPAWATKGPHA